MAHQQHSGSAGTAALSTASVVSLYANVPDVVTSDAQHLHVSALLHSLMDGDHGFVSDFYLAARGSCTQTLVRDLRRAGIWRRVPGGYRPTEDEVLRVVTAIADALDVLSERFEACHGTIPARTPLVLADVPVDPDARPGPFGSA